VAVNVALVDPLFTVVDAGTVNAAALLDSATTAPPAPAALDRVTVQLDAPPEPRLVGVHDTRLTVAGDDNVIDVFWVTPLYVAVTTET
jgi:hypothetical protein